MRSTTTKEFNHAIVIWPEDLKYLDAALRKTFTRVEYEVHCQDDTKLEPVNLKQLLEYENPDFRKIISLSLKASTDKPLSDSITILLGRPNRFSNATASVHYKFEDIINQATIEQDITSRINALRPWHFWLTKISFAALLPMALLGLSIIVNIVNVIGKLFGTIRPASTASSFFTEGEATVLMFAVFGFLFLVGHFLDRSRSFLFPKVWFCIGRQQKAYEKRKGIANFVFVVIIVGIIVNIVGAFLTPK